MFKKIIAVGSLAGLSFLLVVMGESIIEKKSTELDRGKTINEMVDEEQVIRKEKGISVVIDPGHGGYDPGKIGINEALEKDINLVIALEIETLLKNKGYQVVMTRNTDKAMEVDGETLDKMKDLEARVEVINTSPSEIAISIHQNSYTSEGVKGAQVFYYTGSEQGEMLAHLMQESLRQLDPSNHRQIKDNSSYYLLKRTEIPTIIVECGFLSNYEEAQMLCDESYQKELAERIVYGIENYLESLGNGV